MSQCFLLLIILLSGPFAAAKDDLHEEGLEKTEDITASDCHELLALPPGNAISFYRNRLPDSKGYRFTKRELEVLFEFKLRAQNDREKLTMIETPEEQRLVGQILGRKVSLTEIFSYKTIVEKILLGAFQRLAVKFARIKSFLYPQIDFDDLVQGSMIGLHQTILEYDHRGSYMISTWAFNKMQRPLQDNINAQLTSWRMGNVNLYLPILRVQKTLWQVFGRRPTAQEITDSYNRRYRTPTNLPYVEQFLLEQRVNAATKSMSLGGGSIEILDSDDFDQHESQSIEAVVDDALYNGQDRHDPFWRKRLADMLSSLPPREAKVICLYYGVCAVRVSETEWTVELVDLDMTLEKVGDMMNVTRERIRQILARAIHMLKHPSRSGIIRESYQR